MTVQSSPMPQTSKFRSYFEAVIINIISGAIASGLGWAVILLWDSKPLYVFLVAAVIRLEDHLRRLDEGAVRDAIDEVGVEILDAFRDGLKQHCEVLVVSGNNYSTDLRRGQFHRRAQNLRATILRGCTSSGTRPTKCRPNGSGPSSPTPTA